MTAYERCSHLPHGQPCDLGGPRQEMCEACLTYLVRLERPPGWSPRVVRHEGATEDGNDE